jgi:hypothetical protein
MGAVAMGYPGRRSAKPKIIFMFQRQTREWIEACKRDIRKAKAELYEHFHRRHQPHPVHESRFTFIFNTLKFSAMETPQLTVPSGTPVSGFNAPLDSGTNVLPNSAYKTGSCKYTVVPGPSGKDPGFTVSAPSDEEDFVVTENTPGADSDGQINFDAQDVNGNQLPTSSGILTFKGTQAPPPPPPPPVAVASQFNFNQVPAAASTGTQASS